MPSDAASKSARKSPTSRAVAAICTGGSRDSKNSTVRTSSSRSSMLAVAGLSVNNLSSVKSSRPAIELPDQPIRTLNTISPAVPSCRLRYCAERWLSVRPRTMRNVALRNVETSAAKYSTSRRCTTPRAMLEKCVTGLSA